MKRSRLVSLVVSPVALLGLLASSACGSGDTDPGPEETPAPPASIGGSVVSTAGSSAEQQAGVPADVRNSWSGFAADEGLQWVRVAADGSTTDEPVAVQTPEAETALMQRVNAEHAAAPGGRSTLRGLQAVDSPAGTPVWVFSPLLDTQDPIDFRQLAFDESPSSVVKAVRKADALPDLKGREVTFVVTAVAGAQEPLTELQVGYLHAVWENLAKAAGAKRVNFVAGPQAEPGTGEMPVIDIPKADDVSEKSEGSTRTCTLPTPALFKPDTPTLIDRSATRKALQKCVGEATSATQIVVEGHTAGTAGTDNKFAKNLSTQRATEVAAVLKELDVPARNITEVVGYGSEKPLVKPGTDPRNRAVVVTFKTTS